MTLFILEYASSFQIFKFSNQIFVTYGVKITIAQMMMMLCCYVINAIMDGIHAMVISEER